MTYRIDTPRNDTVHLEALLKQLAAFRSETGVRTMKKPETLLEGVTNVHPADELADVRAGIAILTKRADALRDQLLAEGADLKGDIHTAVITPGVRETLDRKALIEVFGEKAIAPFIKKTSFQTVKLVEH